MGESLGRDASHWRSGRGLSDSMLCYTCLEAISYIPSNFYGNPLRHTLAILDYCLY